VIDATLANSASPLGRVGNTDVQRHHLLLPEQASRISGILNANGGVRPVVQPTGIPAENNRRP
jgi:hypothetical protein